MLLALWRAGEGFSVIEDNALVAIVRYRGKLKFVDAVLRLKELRHDIWSHFYDVENFLQIEGKLKIIVRSG